MYVLHRELGYLMLIFILVGAVIWWIAVYHACSYGSVRACRAFYPEGNYFDIRGPPWFCENVPTDHEFYRVWLNYSACVVKSGGNPGAVLFLRQVITFLLTMICITAEFKYPLLSSQTGRAVDEAEKAKQNPSRWLAWVAEAQGKVSAFFSKLYKDVLGPNEFEVFIYTHIFITYAIAVAAFFSRFEVFHAAAVCWGLFFLDKLVIVLLHTHTFRISKESEMYEGAMKLVLKKRHWFPWKSKAGEIAFLHCPRIGPFWLGRQWHAFSLASSNSLSADDTHDQIEFLIQVHAKGSWTHTLSRALFDPKSKLSYHSPIYVHVRGPFGSSFQGYREADVIMLIGGGSGIASSLSVLRELVAFRGNVKKVWFIFATRQFSSLQWCWRAINEIIEPSDPALATQGFIRMSIHFSAKLNRAQAQFVANNGALRYLYRPGRPDWKKLFRSFGVQSVAASGPLKTKILACANKQIYADVERALIEVNNPNLSPDFSSENFE